MESIHTEYIKQRNFSYIVPQSFLSRLRLVVFSSACMYHAHAHTVPCAHIQVSLHSNVVFSSKTESRVLAFSFPTCIYSNTHIFTTFHHSAWVHVCASFHCWFWVLWQVKYWG